MRILSISSILPVPGITTENTFVLESYRQLLAGSPEDEVLILKPFRLNTNPRKMSQQNNPLKRLRKGRSFSVEGFRVEALPFLSTWRFRSLHALVCETLFLINRKRIMRILKDFPADIIHAQYILPDGMLARKLSRKLGIPYLLTTHNERFYFEHRYSGKVALSLLRDARYILPLNHSNYTYFRSRGIYNIHMAPLGFDPVFLREQKKDKPAKIRIITVSVLVKLKNIDQVIRAVKRLANEYDIEYQIVGEGPERTALQSLIGELGMGKVVSLTGRKDKEEVAEAMYQSDIFIMPSYFETFGRVYFEAMAMGVPIVCARASGISGLFKEGREGFSVSHRDLNEITETLRMLISNNELRKSMGKAGQKMVKNYTWDKVAGDLRKRYSMALETQA